MYELGMWDWEYEIDLREGLVNTYSDEGKTNPKHKPDNCKVTGKLVNTDCLFAAPKNGLDLEGDNKQRDNSSIISSLSGYAKELYLFRVVTLFVITFQI